MIETSVNIKEEIHKVIKDRGWNYRELIEDGVIFRLNYDQRDAQITALKEENLRLVEKLGKWATKHYELEKRLRILEDGKDDSTRQGSI